MVSEKSFTLLVVSSTTPFFAVLAIIFGQDCRHVKYGLLFTLHLAFFRHLNYRVRTGNAGLKQLKTKAVYICMQDISKLKHLF